ncbi:MAG: deoxyribose-phosphate aldolase [Eubacteriales bacterium]|nr:deoxyribose-phosphate aldolase [Eubacteriales bacterium]
MNKYIDLTQLKPYAGESDIIALCDAAREMNTAGVCVHPCHAAMAKRLLEGTDVKICTVIGFPLGANTTAVKEAETNIAYTDGCDEFDMVINIGALKDKRYDYVCRDIESVVKAAKGKTVKVIIETFWLTDEEKVIACELACRAGAHFVKTCSGFNDGAATVKDVKLMKAAVTKDVKIKASAGIRTYEQALALIEAGAERLGTSAVLKP